MTTVAETKIATLLAEKLLAWDLGTGAQITAWDARGQRQSVAIGKCGNASVEESTLHQSYCLTKPLLPLAIGLLVDDGAANLDDPLAVPVVEGLSITLRDVLAHDAGLAEPRAITWRLMSERERLQRPTPSKRSEYSEFAIGLVCGEVIRDSTGIEPAAFVRDHILKPLGLDADILVTSEEGLEALSSDRMLCPVGATRCGPTPMLSEMMASTVSMATPVFGAFSTAAGIADLYWSLLQVWNGMTIVGLPSAPTLHNMLIGGPPRWDRTLRRECSFAGGFMTLLRTHRVGTTLSDYAFGHTAGLATAVGLCDPQHNVAFGVYLNGAAEPFRDTSPGRVDVIDSLMELLT